MKRVITAAFFLGVLAGCQSNTEEALARAGHDGKVYWVNGTAYCRDPHDPGEYPGMSWERDTLWKAEDQARPDCHNYRLLKQWTCQGETCWDDPQYELLPDAQE